MNTAAANTTTAQAPAKPAKPKKKYYGVGEIQFDETGQAFGKLRMLDHQMKLKLVPWVRSDGEPSSERAPSHKLLADKGIGGAEIGIVWKDKTLTSGEDCFNLVFDGPPFHRDPLKVTAYKNSGPDAAPGEFKLMWCAPDQTQQKNPDAWAQ